MPSSPPLYSSIDVCEALDKLESTLGNALWVVRQTPTKWDDVAVSGLLALVKAVKDSPELMQFLHDLLGDNHVIEAARRGDLDGVMQAINASEVLQVVIDTLKWTKAEAAAYLAWCVNQIVSYWGAK